MAVAATVIAATAAAMLLPGRDGSGVYLAVGLVAVVDAIGSGPRPGWSVTALLALTALGLMVGARLPSMFIAIVLIAGLAVFALVQSADHHRYVIAASSAAIGLTAGYCCGAARPRYAPSGVLAISALYLPSIVTAWPPTTKRWRGGPHSPSSAAAPSVWRCCADSGRAVDRNRTIPPKTKR
jgi:hypothetical protein